MEAFSVIPDVSTAKAIAIASGFGALAFGVSIALATTTLEAFLSGAAVAGGLLFWFHLLRRAGPVLRHRARFTLGGAAFVGAMLTVPAFALDDIEDAILVCGLSFIVGVGAIWLGTSARIQSRFSAQLMKPLTGGELCPECGMARPRAPRCNWCGCPTENPA